jgi:hypothetical protein
MPAAAKKTAPRTARPKVVEPAVDRFDLLSVLETEDQEPEPITFRGIDAEIRRSYTGEDVIKFEHFIDKKDFPGVLTLIAGDAGVKLWQEIGKLNTHHASKVLNRIFMISTLAEGEIIAPLPASFMGMAGAQPSLDSGDTSS